MGLRSHLDKKLIKEERFSHAKTISGTQKLHRFVPINNTELTVYDLSQSSVSTTVTICDFDNDQTIEEIDSLEGLELSPGATFVVCQYDMKWWIGLVKSKSEEFDDYFISFMTPSGQAKQYSWPDKEDTCWIDKTNILCTIQCPAITSSSTRGFVFTSSDLKRAESYFIKKQKNN